MMDAMEGVGKAGGAVGSLSKLIRASSSRCRLAVAERCCCCFCSCAFLAVHGRIFPGNVPVAAVQAADQHPSNAGRRRASRAGKQ